jgi:hypothetical protein
LVAFRVWVPLLRDVFKGKSHGGTLHGNQEESKKEETLTVSRKILSHGPRISTSLSGEAPLERRFLFATAIFKPEVRHSKFFLLGARPVSQY